MTADQQEQVAQFVSRYYKLINQDPSLALSHYDKKAKFSWPTVYGTTVDAKTAESIYKFHVDNVSAQSSPSGVLLVVRGRTGGIGLEEPNSCFVQAFHLEETDGQLIVMNDILTVIPDSKLESKDKQSVIASISKVAIADAKTAKINTSNQGIPTAETAKINTSNQCIPTAETRPRRKTARGIIKDPSKAITASVTKSGKRIGKDVITGPSKATVGDDAQPIMRTSSFGRNLKPTSHLHNVYEVQYKQKEPVAEQKDQVAERKDPVAAEELKEKSSVLIIYDDRMLKHVQVPDPLVQRCHETPERLTHIIDQFSRDSLYARCEFQKAEPASYAQLELVHKPDYVQFVANLPSMSKEDEDKYVDTSMYFSKDEGTRVASFIAAGSVVKACDLVAQKQYKRAFAVVRPPGHHAMENKADGFCLFNNAAIGAAFLQKKYSMKVLVVDIDVHHGNGTQSIFYKNNGVLFISIHSTKVEYLDGPERRIGFIGEGDGEGFNINIPLSGNYGDGDLLYVWDQIVLPIAKEFDPNIVIISAGYDAAKGDPMSRCKLTPKGYATFTSMVGQVGTGCVIMVLEGGYNLEVTADCASHCVRALLGDVDVLHENTRIVPLVSTKKTVKDVRSSMSKYWDVFKDSRP